MDNNLLVAARITGTYHLKGEVKAVTFLDDTNVLVGERVILQRKNDSSDKQVATITSVKKINGDKIILEFAEIENKMQAAELANYNILIKKEILGVSEDEYLVSELIGMKVVTVDGNTIGSVDEVFETAAHDVYTVSADSSYVDAANDKKEIMIPAVDEFVKEIDFEKRIIVVELIEGM